MRIACRASARLARRGVLRKVTSAATISGGASAKERCTRRWSEPSRSGRAEMIRERLLVRISEARRGPSCWTSTCSRPSPLRLGGAETGAGRGAEGAGGGRRRRAPRRRLGPAEEPLAPRVGGRGVARKLVFRRRGELGKEGELERLFGRLALEHRKCGGAYTSGGHFSYIPASWAARRTGAGPGVAQAAPAVFLEFAMTSFACRSCSAPLSEVLVDLGSSPLANSYLEPEKMQTGEVYYPLCVYLCHQCWLAQLPEFESSEGIFSDYAYFSSFSDSWLDHARRYVEAVSERFGLGERSQVIEIASNDGYLLQYFKERKAFPAWASSRPPTWPKRRSPKASPAGSSSSAARAPAGWSRKASPPTSCWATTCWPTCPT